MKKMLIGMAFAYMAMACGSKKYDLIIRNGQVYDGNGGLPFKADIGINHDTIAYIGSLSAYQGKQEIDAQGMVVSPGFINLLSWAAVPLIEDGRSMSDIQQGVTLEVFGEGESMGPLNAQMKKDLLADQSHIHYPIEWTSLGEFMQWLTKKGVSCNVASFVGATTIRTHVLGEANRDPSPSELEQMKSLVKQAMEEGALGIGSSLIYPPAFFAKTQELIELCKVTAPYGATYVSHLRSEGNQFLEALEELITIASTAGVHGEVYHLKAAGINNWKKMDSAIHRIHQANHAGISIGANMYLYTAGATGLSAAFPPSLQDGGFGKMHERLQNPTIRKSMIEAMKSNPNDWENLYYGAGDPKNIILLGFRKASLQKYIGKTLAEVAQLYKQSAEETAIDLIVQDSSRVEVAYFLMKEANIRKQVALPWMSFGSDAGSMAPEGAFLQQSTHPRAYGNFARLLAKYVRDEKLITLSSAIHQLTKLAATKLHISKRGELKKGNFADLVIFDLSQIQDLASFEKPQQLAKGMQHVFVNGKQVLKWGEHTGALPGRFVKRG